MRLWIGAEVHDEVDAKHRNARRTLEGRINQTLERHTFQGPWLKWAFISIIMRRADALEEVERRNSRAKVLEFRYRLDHSKFRAAGQLEATRMVLAALRRSVEKMPGLGVPAADVEFLRATLAELEVV